MLLFCCYCSSSCFCFCCRCCLLLLLLLLLSCLLSLSLPFSLSFSLSFSLCWWHLYHFFLILFLFSSSSQSTFNYSSPFWTNTATYKEENGEDLNEKETKLATFGVHQLEKGYCLGMRVSGTTNWMVLPWKSDILISRFQQSSETRTTIDENKWRSLVNNSSMQVY